jgi:hypothetical protein
VVVEVVEVGSVVGGTVVDVVDVVVDVVDVVVVVVVGQGSSLSGTLQGLTSMISCLGRYRTFHSWLLVAP